MNFLSLSPSSHKLLIVRSHDFLRHVASPSNSTNMTHTLFLVCLVMRPSMHHTRWFVTFITYRPESLSCYCINNWRVGNESEIDTKFCSRFSIYVSQMLVSLRSSWVTRCTPEDVSSPNRLSAQNAEQIKGGKEVRVVVPPDTRLARSPSPFLLVSAFGNCPSRLCEVEVFAVYFFKAF